MAPALSRLYSALLPVLLLLLLAVSLYLLIILVQDAAAFARYQIWVLGFNLVLLILFVVLIIRNTVYLRRRRAAGKSGARLTIKLAKNFIVFALVPAAVVYAFSSWMLNRGIDSWFSADVEQALQDALELSRHSLNLQLNQYQKQLEPLLKELAEVPDDLIEYQLSGYIKKTNASEFLVLGGDQHIISAVTSDVSNLLPDLPTQAVLRQVFNGERYLGIDPVKHRGLYARLVFPVPRPEAMTEIRVFQALYPVSERANTFAGNVQDTYQRYNQLEFLRDALRQNFTVILSLVLVSGILYAVWASFFSARRLMRPISMLTEATRAVGAGKLDTQLQKTSRDDFGALIESFNHMTQSLSEARDTSAHSRRQLETQRTYLHTVLGSISSGVLSMDRQFVLKTANPAAGKILYATFDSLIDQVVFSSITGSVARFFEKLKPCLDGGSDTWEEQFNLTLNGTYKSLLCRGTKMSNGGYVVVFDDITQIVQAHRETAWGEVARRLAHEIKNPLTPIHLSADHLRKKLLPKLHTSDQEFVDRSVRTIVEQVKAMKQMVDEFSQYSRPAALKLKPLQLNFLVNEVLDLYQSAEVRIEVDLSAVELWVAGDGPRLRQLVHNLLKNAVEAVALQSDGHIFVATRIKQDDNTMVEIETSDNGPGFDATLLANLFEPYVTTKNKGKGLGLAIVKKIVEEHHGQVNVSNRRQGGASVIVSLPRIESEV